jgi:HTH-type transcriptional regulator / antitoxin HipB
LLIFAHVLNIRQIINEKKVTMEEMKFYSEEEMLDKHVGKIGTPHRDQFEDEINTFLIGEAIKEARKNKKLTQEQLGNLIGVKKGQISKIENGKNLTLNTISRVLHAMGLQAHLNIPTVGQYAI